MEKTVVINADVAVVGGGAAGSVAAYKLAKMGKKVVLLEKGNSFGSSNFARLSGFMGCETAFQKEKGITVANKGTLYKHYTDWGKGEINHKLIKSLLECSAEAADLLSEMGFTFSAYADWVDSANKEKYLNDLTWAPLHLINEYGLERAKILESSLKNIGVEICFGTAAKELIMESGRVTGVMGVRKNGETINVLAENVFVACGGFGNNKDMIKDFYQGAPLCNLGSKNNTGDGIKLVLEAGGVLSPGMGLTGNEVCGANMKHREYPFDADYRMDNDNLGFATYGGLFVDGDGERFFNEELMATAPLATAPFPAYSVGPMYVIMDGEYYEACCEQGIYDYLGKPDWDFGSHLFVPVLDRAKEQLDDAIREGWAVKADSIKEIANRFGLRNLEETIGRYNEQCRSKEDTDFGKSKIFMTEIKKGCGYYAFEYVGSYWCTLGGVKTDASLHVLDCDNNIIEGIFVGGSEMGSAFGRTYYDIAASCAGFSVSSGVLAAKKMFA